MAPNLVSDNGFAGLETWDMAGLPLKEASCQLRLGPRCVRGYDFISPRSFTMPAFAQVTL